MLPELGLIGFGDGQAGRGRRRDGMAGRHVPLAAELLHLPDKPAGVVKSSQLYRNLQIFELHDHRLQFHVALPVGVVEVQPTVGGGVVGLVVDGLVVLGLIVLSSSCLSSRGSLTAK
jgi:hypothetical protein